MIEISGPEPVENITSYDELLARNVNAPESLKLALKEAEENRRFEIGLYWQRSGYFWLFVAAAFTGYFFLAISENDEAFDLKTGRLLLAWSGLVERQDN